MSAQTSLFPDLDHKYPDDLTPRQRFEHFHERNPAVCDRLTERALRLKRRGRRSFGIGALYEVLRYDNALQTERDREPWKLNNNYRAYYARLIMQRTPELAGFFRLRSSDADNL